MRTVLYVYDTAFVPFAAGADAGHLFVTCSIDSHCALCALFLTLCVGGTAALRRAKIWINGSYFFAYSLFVST